MLFAKTDLKSRLLNGTYKHEDDDNTSTGTSEVSAENNNAEKDMFETEDEETRKQPYKGYCYCTFTILIWCVLSIYVGV